MIVAIVACAVPLFLAFCGAILAFGKLTQSVHHLEKKVSWCEELAVKVAEIGERTATLEGIIESRR